MLPVELVEEIVGLYVNLKAATIQRWWRAHAMKRKTFLCNCIRPPWTPERPIINDYYLYDFFNGSVFL
jgi:hypothetical protein